MSSSVDILEERVSAAAELIVRLRARVRSLEQDLEIIRVEPPVTPCTNPAAAPDPALLEELERLRAERVAVRESIRGLLREIDRVSW